MKKIDLKIKWHKKGWAEEGQNGELFTNPKIEVLSSSESNPTNEEKRAITKAIADYEQSQAGGELIKDNELDSLRVIIK